MALSVGRNRADGTSLTNIDVDLVWDDGGTPTAPVSGDLLVVCIGWNKASPAAVLTPPSGWTEVYLGDDGGTFNSVGVYTKTATGSEGSTLNVAWDRVTGAINVHTWVYHDPAGAPTLSSFTIDNQVANADNYIWSSGAGDELKEYWLRLSNLSGGGWVWTNGTDGGSGNYGGCGYLGAPDASVQAEWTTSRRYSAVTWYATPAAGGADEAALGIAGAEVAALPLAASPGGLSGALGSIPVAAAAQALASVPGGLSRSLGIVGASVQATALATSSVVSRALGALGAAAESRALLAAPGGLSRALGAAGAATAARPISAAAGGVTRALSRISASAQAAPLASLSGDTRALASAVASVASRGLSAVSGTLSRVLGPSQASGATGTLGTAPGGLSRALGALAGLAQALGLGWSVDTGGARVVLVPARRDGILVGAARWLYTVSPSTRVLMEGTMHDLELAPGEIETFVVDARAWFTDRGLTIGAPSVTEEGTISLAPAVASHAYGASLVLTVPGDTDTGYEVRVRVRIASDDPNQVMVRTLRVAVVDRYVAVTDAV